MKHIQIPACRRLKAVWWGSATSLPVHCSYAWCFSPWNNHPLLVTLQREALGLVQTNTEQPGRKLPSCSFLIGSNPREYLTESYTSWRCSLLLRKHPRGHIFPTAWRNSSSLTKHHHCDTQKIPEEKITQSDLPDGWHVECFLGILCFTEP